MLKFAAIAIVAIGAIGLSADAFAQAQGKSYYGKAQHGQPGGVQIQGNTSINANAKNVNTTAIGQGNTADTAIGAIRGGTQIQGNTRINANAKNVNTTAIGQGNKAKASVGTIGQ